MAANSVVTFGTAPVFGPKDWSPKDPANLPKCPRGNSTFSELSQLKLDPCACFFNAPVAAAQDVYGIQLPEAEIKAAFDELKAQGKFNPGSGGKFVDGVDAARRLWHRLNPRLPLASWRVPFGSAAMAYAIGKGYSVTIGVRASKAWKDDVGDDGMVNGPSVVPEGAYGHCVRMVAGPEIVDNYPELPAPWRNRYGIKDVSARLASGQIMPWCYFFTPYPKRMDEAILATMVDRGLFNGQELDRPATRREVALMLGRTLDKVNPEFKAALEAKLTS
jgi:hypothetical protein